MALQTRSEKGQMTRQYVRAAFVPESFNREKRTVDVVWTTGYKGLRRSWRGNYYEELSLDPKHVRMGRLQSGNSPLLDCHNGWSLSSVLGVVDSASLMKKEGRATVRFSSREDVEPIMRDVEEGILRNISVGYDVFTYEMVEEADGTVPTYRAIDWEPAELSLVPIGFDPDAHVRSYGATEHEQRAEAESLHEVTFISSVRGDAADNQEGNTMTPEELAAQQKREQEERDRLARDAQNSAVAEATRNAQVALTARNVEIQTACRAAGLDTAFENTLIADAAMTMDQARAKILDALAARSAGQPGTTGVSPVPGNGNIQNGEAARDKWVEGNTNWILEKSGVRNKYPAFKDLTGGEFRGLRMLDIAREALERNGVNHRGMAPADVIGKAFTFRRDFNGTSDFGVLLENVMHKILLAGYQHAETTWQRFSSIGSFSDFRPHPRYRKGSFGRLDRVNEHGEFLQKQIPDGAKESIQGDTFGNIIGLTRQAMINDDMGVFNTLAADFGESAALTIELMVYELLALNGGLGPLMADGKTLFHADHKNITTSAALTAANLDLDRVAMARQMDLSGNHFLTLSPKLMLIRTELRSTAKKINNDTYDPDSEANRAQLRSNPVNGMLNDIVDTPRLSDNRRYLFEDKNRAPVIEVSFLDGNQTPVLEQRDGWRHDGTEWKLRHDVAVGAVAVEGAVTNAGG
jgi:hypothetical protein